MDLIAPSSKEEVVGALRSASGRESRVTIVEESPLAYTFRMEMQAPDGKWMPMMESRNTKVQ